MSILPSPYIKLPNDVLTTGEYSKMSYIYVLSSVTDYAIQSYMPPSTAVALMNLYVCVIASWGVCHTGPTRLTRITITMIPQTAIDFKPNYFMYLAITTQHNRTSKSAQLPVTDYVTLAERNLLAESVRVSWTTIRGLRGGLITHTSSIQLFFLA